jgi:hypothetical protein
MGLLALGCVFETEIMDLRPLTNKDSFFDENCQFYQIFIVHTTQKIYNFSGLSKSHIGIIIAYN